ncbi:MAG: ATP-binding protein [Fimbriimonadaceae bacterium]|nr:ATP-binding protein [Fimbriimonadaceae bacterium]
MRILLSNLGLLPHAELRLAPLTIICGDNNSGKTYATYAIHGLFSYLHETHELPVDDLVIDTLLRAGTAHVPLGPYLEKAQAHMTAACASFSRRLAAVFAAREEHFRGAAVEVLLEDGDLQIPPSYRRGLSSASAEVFTISKEPADDHLVLTLLGEGDRPPLPREVLQHLIGEGLCQVLFGALFPRPFVVTAERTGIAVFRKELNFPRNRLIEELADTNKEVDMFDLLTKVYTDYAMPVKHNVEFTRNLAAVSKDSSFIATQHSGILDAFSTIIGGRYQVTPDDQVVFRPAAQPKLLLTMDESSSAVRSCLALRFYLHHVARVGDLLILDEPELSLHPRNQVLMARLLVRLLHVGLRIMITTHSDYLIRELNTMILIQSGGDRGEAIATQHGYQPEERLRPEEVALYSARQSQVKRPGYKNRRSVPTLVRAPITADRGIAADTFDDTIEGLNNIQDELIWEGFGG